MSFTLNASPPLSPRIRCPTQTRAASCLGKKATPPVNPAKASDSRFDTYVERYGYDCWELDALKPDVLERIVESAILQHCDVNEFNRVTEQTEEGKAKLMAIADKGV